MSDPDKQNCFSNQKVYSRQQRYCAQPSLFIIAFCGSVPFCRVKIRRGCCNCLNARLFIIRYGVDVMLDGWNVKLPFFIKHHFNLFINKQNLIHLFVKFRIAFLAVHILEKAGSHIPSRRERVSLLTTVILEKT